MCSKIIFFVATLCVVNASVITNDVYNEVPYSGVNEGPVYCKIKPCDLLCRRIGYTGGSCVDGRCKCDNYKRDGDELPQVEDLEEGTSIDDSEDPIPVPEDYLRSCTIKQCMKRCQVVGLYGICVKNRCVCKTQIKTAVPEFTGEELNFAANSQDTLEDSLSVPELETRKCQAKSCSRLCQKYGLIGICLKNRCICRSHIKSEEAVPASEDLDFLNNNDELVLEGFDVKETDLAFSRGCRPKTCVRTCRKLGFKSGTCVGRRCQCTGGEDAAPTTTVATTVPTEAPRPEE
ncbi:uncharacterized protein LOC142974299 [Anticarsia gemmatalis]|uniref:uncharacterized protein LOC142974299 n=1 Tax=Anticarsia gemmatalis TaxID=129554 RepID=UPI003F77171D